MPTFSIEEIATPPEDVRESVYSLLREHNATTNPVFWVARDEPRNSPRELNLFAFDAAGSVIGGLFASTQFKWLKVDIMATRPEVRGQGVGGALLARAEEEARARGCSYAYVDTMDYQAPGFYERAGYRIAGELPDWDSHGHTKLFFVKPLSPEITPA